MNRSNLIGQTLGGRYRIDELLGQGGMATVYKAHDPNLNRAVAIKIIKTGLSDDPKFLARFETEATAVAQLRHRNIVQVFDFSHDDDLYYMVQEFIAGETLNDHLRRLNQAGRSMPLDKVIDYTTEICDAAGYAHRRGMIHRDIKPANIMLDVHDQAVLMDFGIVKIADSLEHTVTGAVVGTARYMPPELIRGEMPDARSDIYSLGITLYEMVSGQPPFDANSAMTLLMMHLQDPVPDVRVQRPDVPASLVDVIGKALAKEQETRYGTMAAMALALKGVQEEMRGGQALHVQATELDQPGEESPGSARTQLDAPSEPETPAWGPGIPAAGQTPPPGWQGSGSGQTPPPGWQGSGPGQTPPPGWQGSGSGQTPPPGWQGSGSGQTPPPGWQGWNAGQTPPPGWQGSGSGQTPPPGGPSWGSAIPGQGAQRPRLAVTGRWRMWLGIGVLVLAVAAGLGFLGAKAFGGNGGQTNLQPPAAAGATATPGNSATPAPSPTAPPSSPTAPSYPPYGGAANTPSPATPAPAEPTPGPDASVTITGIQVNSQGNYVVDFTTKDYTPALPGTHIHFYFNTFAIDQIGIGGDANRYAWGAPSPFIGYATSDRPDGATQLCAIVANPNHSVRDGSGNCLTLPDIATVTSNQEIPCLFGPGTSYPAISELPANLPALLQGLSADEQWWNVINPQDPSQSCWVPIAGTQQSGSIEQLPIVPPPPENTVPSVPSVQITGITVDDKGNYVVDFTTKNYTPALPGTHIHFYFDTFTIDQIGIGGDANRYAWGAPSPFIGYTSADRPVEASEMCAIVANPDHSVIAGSGNCFPLPALSVEITNVTLNAQNQYVVDFTANGFVPTIPGTHIHFYFNTYTIDQIGIGGDANRYAWNAPPPFIGYTSADRPDGATKMCAIVANPNHSVIAGSGNCYPLPDVMAVEITNITVNQQGHYVVDYDTWGFTLHDPGTHVHFYFDTQSPDHLDQLGIGHRYSSGNSKPFTGLTTADRPAGAAQMCAVVIRPDNSVVAGSGDCFPLP